MLNLDFSDNFNGKLFHDAWIDICIATPDYVPGAEYKISYKGQDLGIAKIYHLASFAANRLTDAAAMIATGQTAVALRASLSRRTFGNMKMPDDIKLYRALFIYTERNFSNQSILIKHWWAEKSNNLWNQS